jgi:hypothetical protein
MEKQEIINQFTKSLVKEKIRKNKVTASGITNTLFTAAVNSAFVNESCKSTGQVSKSQVIYRKLEDINLEKISEYFKANTLKFLILLKIFSRNRKFILSCDTTKEPFYGEFSKAIDSLYLHQGSIAKESYTYYEFITISITGNYHQKYILDGMIMPIGFNTVKWIKESLKWIKDKLKIEVVLFDRGFTSKELVYELNKLKISYIIFWKKQGNWHKPIFENMDDGDLKFVNRKDKFYRTKNRYDIKIKFVFIKRLKYENKEYDWIFATNLVLEKAKYYVKLYKKRWGIETIYRVTDNIRIYTTSTNSIIRYFLFMFTCFVYNIWKFFQIFLDEEFTLSNFKSNTIIYLAKTGKIYPKHFDEFEIIASKII